MSQSPPSSFKSPATTASSTNFNVIFEKALKAYKAKTKQDLTTHPLASQLRACNSPTAILTILQDQVHQFKQSQSTDERLQRWLNPTINVLYAYSAILSRRVGLVFSPTQVIFAGAGVLLLAAKDVEASQDLLIEIFKHIENSFRRLEIYTDVSPTLAMTGKMVKIMIEVLDILVTATKEMNQSRFKKFLKKVAGSTKLEDGLQKLDKMTNEEGVDKKVQGIANQVKDVVMKVQAVNKDVQVVSKQVQGVNENVKVVKEKVQVVIDDGKKAVTEVKLVMLQIAYNIDDANHLEAIMREP
ncbi:hypothetical protein EI94DRAFT_1801193 [Lactarius quietus]|nr:hypothetical protein EI94DRAFT_1801193 [Lactarius quietus]